MRISIYLYIEKENNPKTTKGRYNMKITGLEIINEIVEREDKTRKAEKEIRKQRIKDLIARGIDKTVAEIMVDTFTAYSVRGY